MERLVGDHRNVFDSFTWASHLQFFVHFGECSFFPFSFQTVEKRQELKQLAMGHKINLTLTSLAFSTLNTPWNTKDRRVRITAWLRRCRRPSCLGNC